MRRLFILALTGFLIAPLHSQMVKPKKYPSLLWEISGKGIRKPSYLIGTMHVSNKLAFNLPDSFYLALRSVDVVALENNPESWQDDMSRYEIGMETGDGSDLENTPAQYLTQNAIKFYRYYGKLQRALSSNPSSLNNLLYRNYGSESSDFEEDTYLDMYIFQCGKKWGKRIAGVESYGESMRLMMEAYRDAAKDKKKKDRSYGDFNGQFSNDKLQEAYRTGNLDLLDSINHYNSTSEAFDEKFIYRRNEIQAYSIDSIIRSGSSLFVGVGAAHLPGNRGVIELLRSMGYSLRPVKMGERASKQKELVDRIRVPVVFQTEMAEDGCFSVNVPGKLYRLSDDEALKQNQFADLANGSYYMVTRLMTNAWMWDQDSAQILKKVDSLLYEHIPGKIISRAYIQRNGYQGLDITNRTRRGDLQRYNIFVTPFEVILFKMSGTGDYVKQGTEADRFFGSIKLKEYKSANGAGVRFKPSFGGFSVEFPHEPYMGNDGSWIFDARDPATNTCFRVIRTDVNNFRFLEDDSFDLSLLNESFKSSAFIRTEIEKKTGSYHGYPSLEARYIDKFGKYYFTKFILQGSHYYSLIAKAPAMNETVRRFFDSFEILPFTYRRFRQYADSILYFTASSPVYTDSGKVKLNMPRNYYMSWSLDEGKEEIAEKDKLINGVIRTRTIENDSTGEQISVAFLQSSRYAFPSEGQRAADMFRFTPQDSTMIIVKESELPAWEGYQVKETVFADTNSSRRLWSRAWYRPVSGTGYYLVTMIDSAGPPSPFQAGFFDSFRPSVEAFDNTKNATTLFFNDLNSADSVRHKRALQNIDQVELDSSSLKFLEAAIRSLGWKEKKYLDIKTAFINRLGDIQCPASADILERIYFAAGDTLQLQYAALENLLQHRNSYAYDIFGKIMMNDPPVLETNHTWSPLIPEMDAPQIEFDNGSFLDELYDSLSLTRQILPGLLPLLNLKDYEKPVMDLLKNLLDENLISGKDYGDYFTKFYLEARQELKKQSIAEKNKAIDKAENEREGGEVSSIDDKDSGNDDLSVYATLLLPFEAQNKGVSNFIGQLLNSHDRRLVFNTVILLLKNGKKVSDSLIRSLASLDEFRFELYRSLQQLKLPGQFPVEERDQVKLARSALFFQKNYDQPDTMVFIGKRAIEYGKQQGYVFFYKYKMKIIDLNWMIATVGIIPADPDSFNPDIASDPDGIGKKNLLTSLRSARLKEEKPEGPQLDAIIQKWLVGQRKSGKEFYNNDEEEEEE